MGKNKLSFIGCIEDETLARLFLAGFVLGPEPISEKTSDCVRAVFEVIDPREVMTAGVEGDPGRAMAGSMAALSVTMACLNDQEWEASASMMGMRPEEREGIRCLLDQLGGPGEMAAAMIAAGEGTFHGPAQGRGGVRDGHGAGTRPGTHNPSSDAHGDHGSVNPCVHVHTGPDRGGRRQGRSPTTTINLVITIAPIVADIPEYDRSDSRGFGRDKHHHHSDYS